MRQASLRIRVLAVLIVATVVPTVVVGALAIEHASDSVEENVVRGNLALIRSLGVTLDSRLQDTRRTLETAASFWAYTQGQNSRQISGQTSATAGQDPGDTGDRITRMQMDFIKREIPLISTVTILSPEREYRFGDPVPPHIKLTESTPGGRVDDIIFENGLARAHMIIDARDRTSRLVGVFLAGLDLDFAGDALKVLVAESRLGRGARLLIVDNEGRLLASSSEGAEVPGTPLRDTHPAVRQALSSATEGSLEADGNIAVFRSIASFQEIRSVPWAIILEQPTEYAYATARRTMRDTIIAAVAVIVLSLLLGGFLASRLTTPLHELAERADVIASGSDELPDLSPSLARAPGEIGHLVMRFEGMARRVQKREELQAALAHGDRLATIGTMSASVAHELNNPLTTVLGYAKLLLEGKDEDHDDRMGLELIVEEAERMKVIVGAFLDYARSERAPRYEVGTADINATVQHTVDLLGPQLRRWNVKLELNLADELPMVAADTRPLQQVFVNLVQNAAQAMKNSGTVRIDSHMADGGQAVLVSVTDEGPGVPVADRARIFEPFFTTKEASKGTGLGLPVCKYLVTVVGGSIEVDDAPAGTGATFRVKLPAVVAPEPEDP